MTTTKVRYDQLFIDGRWVQSKSGKRIPVINPHDEKEFHSVAQANIADVNDAIEAAAKAFANTTTEIEEGGWRCLTGHQRAAVLRNIAGLVEKNKTQLSRLEVMDCGKPIAEAEWDIDDVAGCFNYYADLAEQLDARQGTPIKLPMAEFQTVLQYDPVGVVALIVPWNYPALMATWKIAPALAAGCSIVLKPSEITSLTALELAQICHDAGVPKGVMNVITGYGHEIGDALVTHKLIDGVAFTGSDTTGSRIMANASKNVTNISLELGGKSALIVFDDVDVEQAVEWIMFGVFWTNGQICSSTSRVLLHENIAEKVCKRLKEEAEKINIENPLKPTSKMGPVVCKAQFDKVRGYITKAIDQGATLLTGGLAKVHDSGYYVRPTVFTNVQQDHAIWNEEIFGPVLAVRTFSTEQQAVQEANTNLYGLANAVMSKDLERCDRVAKALRSGIVWINCSQPCFCHAPWGGVKRSGVGRDLGEYGLNKFLEVKQVTRYLTTDKPWGWYINANL